MQHPQPRPSRRQALAEHLRQSYLPDVPHSVADTLFERACRSYASVGWDLVTDYYQDLAPMVEYAWRNGQDHAPTGSYLSRYPAILPPCSGEGPLRTFAHGTPGATWCEEPVVVLVIDGEWDGGGDMCSTEMFTACRDHAPEVLHEARSSMGEDEFVVLTVAR